LKKIPRKVYRGGGTTGGSGRFFGGSPPIAQTGSGNVVFRGRFSNKGYRAYFLLKARRDISSRFRNSKFFFRFSKPLPVAILDFFKKRSYTCRLIFGPLQDAFYRLSIGRLGAEI
jgi:hypothetical protein